MSGTRFSYLIDCKDIRYNLSKLPTHDLLCFLTECDDLRLYRFFIYDLLYFREQEKIIILPTDNYEYNNVKMFYNNLKIVNRQNRIICPNMYHPSISDMLHIILNYSNENTIYLECNNVIINGILYKVSYEYSEHLMFGKPFPQIHTTPGFTYNKDIAFDETRGVFLTCPSINDGKVKIWLGFDRIYEKVVIHNSDRIKGVLQPAVIEKDCTIYEIYGLPHNDTRINGILQPAVISNTENGWYNHGRRHNDTRINGVLQPAYIEKGVLTEWYINGEYHNDTIIRGRLQPAIIAVGGQTLYYKKNKLVNKVFLRNIYYTLRWLII